MRTWCAALLLLGPVSASAVDEDSAQLEVGAHVGRFGQPMGRSLATGLTFGVRFSKLATVEWGGTVYPVRGRFTPVTVQLVGHGFEELVDLTAAVWSSDLTTRLSPVHGSISGRELPFDLHFLVGVGVVGTQDELDALQCDGLGDSPCALTASQVHVTMSLGAGLRVGLSERVAARLEARAVRWVEVVNGVELKAVAPLLLQASTTIGLGGVTRRRSGG